MSGANFSQLPTTKEWDIPNLVANKADVSRLPLLGTATKWGYQYYWLGR
jgi:hypothetical protein